MEMLVLHEDFASSNILWMLLVQSEVEINIFRKKKAEDISDSVIRKVGAIDTGRIT